MDLVVQVVKPTEAFPREERYSLTDQIRRVAISIPSNIAEGAARRTGKVFANYLHIAQGSLSELDTLFEVAKRLEYVSPREWTALDTPMERIDKMVSGLIRRQKSNQHKP